ncbi:MAG: chromate transporter [Eubacteriales bacterium]|nr:chromate transporter [Eubacteriales bacterium]
MQKKTEDTSLKSSYISLFWEFFKIGTFTIGGGIAMIPQIQSLVVEEKKWMDEEEALDCIALGQSLPGVVAVNLATYVGFRQRGLMGAIAATIGITLPAFLSIIIALALLNYIKGNPFVNGAFIGIKAAVCGLILVSAVRLLRQMVSGGSKAKLFFSIIIATGSFLAVGFFGVTAILVIIIGIIAGILFHIMLTSKEVAK